MSQRILTITFFSLISATCLLGQYNIGIRAGLSQTTFLGPSEPDVMEGYGFNGGFHFGLSFQWNFSDLVGLRSEILYNQTGASYEFQSDNGYYVFALFNTPRFVLRDTSSVRLNHDNAYLHFPQTVHFKIGRKLEVFAGGYFGVLLNPVARGTWTFGGESNQKEHSFRQGLDYDYNSDNAAEFSPFAAPILIRVLGEDVDLPGTVGAYYLQDTKDDDRFFWYRLRPGWRYFLLFKSWTLSYGSSRIWSQRYYSK